MARRRPFALDPAEERRRTVKAVLIALAIGAAGLALALRPATVLGVDAEALANSVEDTLSNASCTGTGDNTWVCHVRGGYGDSSTPPVTYRVETRSFGCWDAWHVAGKDTAKPQASGCITIFDVLGGSNRDD